MNETTAPDRPPENLLIALKKAQAGQGYLPGKTIGKLADSFGLPVSYVYGVASFYSFLAVRPSGKNVVRVCKSLPCHFKGGRDIVKAIAGEIGAGPGQTSPDGRFSFEMTSCVGLCDSAPAMLVNDTPYFGLTPEKAVRVLREYK
jgi:NADH-quinone oxidoreductase subunit E